MQIEIKINEKPDVSLNLDALNPEDRRHMNRYVTCLSEMLDEIASLNLGSVDDILKKYKVCFFKDESSEQIRVGLEFPEPRL